MINRIIIDRDKRKVIKMIDKKHPHNRKIEEFLKKYYSYTNPLVEREVELLTRLEKYDIAPAVLDYDNDSIVMTYCGDSWYKVERKHRIRKAIMKRITPWLINNKSKYVEQVRNILHVLKLEGVKHNDIYNENILIDEHGKIRITDFLLANDERVRGVADLSSEISKRHPMIFCARWTDDTLYMVTGPLSFRRMKKEIIKDLHAMLPASAGKPGANVEAGYVYHSLPFTDIPLKAHRAYSDLRIQKVLSHLPDTARRGLDIGCSIGGLSFALQARGKQMTGIDYDAPSIRFADKVNRAKNYGIKFIHGNYDLSFVREVEDFDFAIWFSSWMWMAQSFGLEVGMKLLLETSRRIPFLFFDTAQGGTDKADSYQMKNAGEVANLLHKNTVYSCIEDLGESEPSYHRRNLFFCHGDMVE